VDFESLSDVLKHPMRRKILSVLYERKTMSYMDLMNFVGATNTGKFNYHLKILSDLIEKDQNGKYVLTEKGQMAAQLLQKFPEKKTRQTPLYMADAALIGFAGIVLIVVNPVFWSSFLIALLKLELSAPYFTIIAVLHFAYTLIVPGAAMWSLTVRRANSHDTYDLFKPPFVAFILLLVLLIAMFLLKINLTVTLTSSATPIPNGGYTYSNMENSLQSLLFLGLMFSFLGVIIAEFVSKVWKRIMS
jgi:glucan phosphoethanolaminetransferase (alkaline phosphatase superfamily)